jgi:hypothetical protein
LKAKNNYFLRAMIRKFFLLGKDPNCINSTILKFTLKKSFLISFFVKK